MRFRDEHYTADAMQMLTKNTMVGGSVGGVLAVLYGIWILTSSVNAYTAQIETNTAATIANTIAVVPIAANTTAIAENTKAIDALSTSLKLSRIDGWTSDAQRERRELKRELLADPDNELIIEQIGTLDDEIKRYGDIRKCVSDGRERCM